MVFIIGIVVLVTAVLGLSNPFAGLLGLLVLNLTQPGEIYPIFNSLHVERVMALIVLISFWAKHRKFEVPPISKRLLYFWGVMFLAVPFAFWAAFALDSAVDFGKVILFHLLVANLIRTQDQFKKYLVVYTIITGWLAGSSLYLHAQGVVTYVQDSERAAGMTSSVGDPNTLGLMLVTAMPILLLTTTRDFGKWTRLLGLAVGVLCTWVVVVTSSRTSFFCLLFVGVLFTLTRKKGFFLVPVAAVLAAAGWMVLPQQYKERYQSVENLEKDESYQNRVRAWRAGWAMFKDNPLTGVGARNFTYANGGKYWPGPGRMVWLNAHSLYFQLPAELGLLGIITFVMYLTAIFKTNLALRRQLKGSPDWGPSLQGFPLAAMFSLLTWLLAGYSSHCLYRGGWFTVGAATAALGMIVSRANADKAATETTDNAVAGHLNASPVQA
jgi:putative inorganic carbon (hco3(-)) transporter